MSERLFVEPYGFDFFQAVRLLERLAQQAQPATPPRGSLPVGQDHSPDEEAVRFRSQPSLSFPGSPIVQLRRFAEDGKGSGKVKPLAEMLVSFMGMTGPMGVLPFHYTSLLLRRMRDKDFSLRDFLDLFHHRSIAFFYRAWVKYRLPFAYERSKLEKSGKEDLVTWGIYCLAGMGSAGLRGRMEIDDEAILYYSGHFAHFPRSAVALETILGDYFGLSIRVLQAHGQWLRLPADEQALMPSRTAPKGLNSQLGVNLVVGERVWDIQSKFRLQVGPLSYEEFRRFLPRGDALRSLCQLTRSYVGPEYDFDVQLVLRAEEAPGTPIGGKKAHMGWNTWMRAHTFKYAVEDAVFSQDEI